MQLNWLRAGCASIAECGTVTFNVYHGNDLWYATRTATEDFEIRSCGGCFTTRKAAEAACETWLDQHDRPVWHDCGDGGWLSWAEWRGGKLIVRPRQGSAPCWAWQVNGEVNAQWDAAATRDAAKAAAERYVREQTGGAA